MVAMDAMIVDLPQVDMTDKPRFLFWVRHECSDNDLLLWCQ